MPRVDGLQVLAEIRRKHPAIKVIMVSAQASLDKVSEAIRAGAVGFIVKPFNAAIVLEKIGRFFQQERKEK
jgi:two-component system chemotaxis response regulator CheY